MMKPAFIQEIFKIHDEQTFRAIALEVFRYQARHIPVYRDYLAALRIDPEEIRTLENIPFLPLEFFRTHRVLHEGMEARMVFESSGTSGMEASRHHVASLDLYKESFSRGYMHFYGEPSGSCILALLPAYLERKGSSLVYMMDRLISASGHPDSGFYLDDLEGLSLVLEKQNQDKIPTLLLGVSFALLELAEKHPQELAEHITVMETGGMKGRRKELIRSELHEILGRAFGKDRIHSEYGMTELLSQAYSEGKGFFTCPPWMKVLIRDPNDPFTILEKGSSGGINLIDLANIYSCSFLATDDLGISYPDHTFEVLGRFDHADVRGCNLLLS